MARLSPLLTSIHRFTKEHRLETVIIFLITVLALILRLYRIDEYLTFLGDEGRDVRIVRDLLKGNLVFIGPQTSVGSMYLGPLYYYMMAPALWLSRLDPVGPAIMIALLSTITIIFTWWVGRIWFNPFAGIIAAIIFTISPVAIIYSHSSWNPNPMPFFALLSIWSIWQVWKNHRYFWLVIAGVAFAAALQMHYLGLLLIPTLGLFWLLTLKATWSDLSSRKALLLHTLYSLLVFVLLMSPLVLFDLKHNGQNLNAFKTFFTNRQTTINLNPTNSDRFLPSVESITSELLLGRQLQHSLLTALTLLVLLIFGYWKSTRFRPQLTLLSAWIGFAVLGLGIYKQHIYAHYFGFLFPAIYLLVGFVLSFLFNQKFFFRLLALLVFLIFVYYALVYSPLRQSPNRQLNRTQEIANLIIRESDQKDFNFGLIAKQNYDESYRYFLENQNARLVRGEEKVVDQLFVVCEDGDACKPEGNPQWQIAVFGPAKIDQQWQIDHIKIYKLIHNQ